MTRRRSESVCGAPCKEDRQQWNAERGDHGDGGAGVTNNDVIYHDDDVYVQSRTQEHFILCDLPRVLAIDNRSRQQRDRSSSKASNHSAAIVTSATIIHAYVLLSNISYYNKLISGSLENENPKSNPASRFAGRTTG